MPYLLTGTAPVRILWKCQAKLCRHIFGFDYLKPIYQHEQRWFNGRPVKDTYPETEHDVTRSGSTLWHDLKSKDALKCPKCSGEVQMIRIKGSYNPDVKCNGRCLNATSGDCDCSCGGQQHGLNHVA